MINNDFNLKGIKYTLPSNTYTLQYIEKIMIATVNSYGYEEIRLPILEKTSLFTRTLGPNSDVIEKEMFTFIDKDKNSLTLRPEGTAGCTKAMINSGSLRNNQKHKVWYIGQMFRREKPQMGRLRQFSQFGIEAYGFKDYDIDLEHIIIINNIFKKLNINNLILEINYIGNKIDRDNYQNDLRNYFKNNIKNLSDINKNRLINNPIRILDDDNVKNKPDIPILVNYLNEDCKKKFFHIKKSLEYLEIPFTINNILVRGLDYYNGLVYEWKTIIDNKKISICAGGRYDTLSQQLNGPETYGCGNAIGIERLELITKNNIKKIEKKLYIVFNKNNEIRYNLKISEKIRYKLNNLEILNGDINKSIEKQIQIAKNMKIKIIIIINDEIHKNIKIINLEKKSEKEIDISEINNHISMQNV
ncbi:MAG TPA: histidine--tRNA ligase [Candidatus Azoamicus sp. OHIO1]